MPRRASVTRLMAESPLPSMIERLGSSVAEAQFAMDKTALEIARLMSLPEQGGITRASDGHQYTLLELGFTPTFYHISNVTIEARIALSSGVSEQFSVGAEVGGQVGFFAASVNASYSNKYSFDANASSSIVAQLNALPPPAILQELLSARNIEINEPDNQ